MIYGGSFFELAFSSLLIRRRRGSVILSTDSKVYVCRSIPYVYSTVKFVPVPSQTHVTLLNAPRLSTLAAERE
jgi:hypothetical protein